MIEQFVIAATAFGSIAVLAAGRTLAGCLIGLIGIPFWIYAVPNDQWGILIAIGVNATVYLAAVILRLSALRRKQKWESKVEVQYGAAIRDPNAKVKVQIDDDEYNHLSDAM